MSEEHLARLRRYFHASMAILFLLLVFYATRSMELEEQEVKVEESEPKTVEVPSLVELTIPKILASVTQTVPIADDIIDMLTQVPDNIRFTVLQQLFEHRNFKQSMLTAGDKIKIVYVVVQNIRVPVILLQLLLEKIIADADPCLFVHKNIADIIPNETNEPSAFGKIVMRALLKSPKMRIPEKDLKNYALRLSLISKLENKQFMISPDDNYLATIVGDQYLFIWDIKTNVPLTYFDAGTEPLNCLEWGQNNVLAAGTEGGKIYFWTIEQLKNATNFIKVPGKYSLFTMENESDEQFLNNFQALSTENKSDITLFGNLIAKGSYTKMLAVSAEQNNETDTWFLGIDQINPEYGISLAGRTENPNIKSIFINKTGFHTLAASTETGFVTVWNITDIKNPTEYWSIEFTENDAVGLALDDTAEHIAYAPIATPENKFAYIYNLKFNQVDNFYITDHYYDDNLGSHTIAMSSDGRYFAHRFENLVQLFHQQTLVGQIDRKHSDATVIFSPIMFDSYGLQSMASCIFGKSTTFVYSLPYNGNITVQLPEWAGLPNSFGNSYLVTEELMMGQLTSINAATIWQLPINYLYGHFTWKQVRDLLAPRCLAIISR